MERRDTVMETRENTKAVAKPDVEVPVKQEQSLAPFFVEAEKLMDKFTEISRETARRAYDFFRDRGGELGRDIDDWLHAESKVLRFVPMEVAEKDGTLQIMAEIGVFKPEEIEISVDGQALMISGESTRTEEKTDKNVLYTDFESDRFFRKVMLPTPVDTNKATAEVKNGVLTITFPKAEEVKPKQIAVTAG
jgi:HSP20 family molecular chaperone IbpA